METKDLFTHTWRIQNEQIVVWCSVVGNSAFGKNDKSNTARHDAKATVKAFLNETSNLQLNTQHSTKPMSTASERCRSCGKKQWKQCHKARLFCCMHQTPDDLVFTGFAWQWLGEIAIAKTSPTDSESLPGSIVMALPLTNATMGQMM